MPATTSASFLPWCTRWFDLLQRAQRWVQTHTWPNAVLKWDTEQWGEIPADFGRK